MDMIDYKTATFEEIYQHIDDIIIEVNASPEFNAKSKAFQVANHLGFFQGVCMARGFQYTVNDIKKWLVMASAF